MRARSRTDRIWWWMSMLVYTVAVILKISGAPLDKATQGVLMARVCEHCGSEEVVRERLSDALLATAPSSREFGASESVSSPANPPQTDAPKET